MNPTTTSPPRATKILVADDEPSVLNVAKRGLERRGYEVLVAPNGRDAIDLFHQHRFDAVISDYYMPDLTGAEVIEQLRREEPNTGFLMVSGHLPEGAEAEDLLPQGVPLLRKPWTLDELAASVGEVLARRR